jgi:hypothetical protein
MLKAADIPDRLRPWADRWGGALGDPVVMIAVATALALGLRVYQLTRPGYLLGVTEYDDGPYFGSAVNLLNGKLPYRDFVLVQPPGITLLMTPAAAVAKAAGTVWGMAAGRVLTTLASTAAVVLAGLLVRHRGLVTVTIACGVLAVYPDSVAAAHTVLVEPWLVLACLAGAVALFDGDRITAGRRRLALGGVMLGFAGATETWAIVPVLVLFALCLFASPQVTPPAGASPAGASPAGESPAGEPAAEPPTAVPSTAAPSTAAPSTAAPSTAAPSTAAPSTAGAPMAGPGRVRRTATFAGGVAAGFVVPVLPFAALAPHRFYQSLVVAQVGPRAAVTRVPVWARLKEMTGLARTLPGIVRFLGVHVPQHAAVEAAAGVIVVLAVGGLILAALAAGRPPAPIEVFALASAAGVVGIFLWPSQFHYHFSAFLGPFLGLAVALPVGALVMELAPARRPGPSGLAWAMTGLAIAVLVVFSYFQVGAEAPLRPNVTPATIDNARGHIPGGSCVVTDEVSLVILADRFVSAAPGCAPVVDGLGTDLALSGGLKPSTGAGLVPAVAAVWQHAFSHASFAWLSRFNARRIAWSPALRSYFLSHYTPVFTDSRGDILYQRKGG